MKTRILAIDPGASGGLVTRFTNGECDACAMPDDADLREYVHTFAMEARLNDEAPVAYLEQVCGYVAGNPAPGSAMFNFGDGYGYIRGLLAMAGVKVVLVRPQTWQAGIPGVRAVKEKAARKRALKEHAARMFPGVKVTLKTADALCIAEYAARVEQGGIAA